MGEVSDLGSEPRPNPVYLVFDARGNGNGRVCCSIVGGASRQGDRLHRNSGRKT